MNWKRAALASLGLALSRVHAAPSTREVLNRRGRPDDRKRRQEDGTGEGGADGTDLPAGRQVRG